VNRQAEAANASRRLAAVSYSCRARCNAMPGATPCAWCGSS